MKKILNSILDFIAEKFELLIDITTYAIIMGVLFIVFCGLKGCYNKVHEIVERTEAKNEKIISYLVQDPRTLNDGRPEWITLGYKNARIYGDYIHFSLDGKSYSTKNFFQITNDQN